MSVPLSITRHSERRIVITVVAGIGSFQNGLELLQLLVRSRMHTIDQQLLD